jgi:hypothetical protein
MGSSCTVTTPPVRLAAPVAVVQPEKSRWPRPEVVALALDAYRCGEREGYFERPVLTIIDYSLPASEPRLWVIDVQTRQILHHELVAHGERSGDNMAVAFSNEIGSHQSSLGLFRTDEVYFGRFGYSLRLSGLEPGVNDNARERAIVVHGLADVSRTTAVQQGTIGRSWGCPALPVEASAKIIDSISGGSAIFAYYPDPSWLQASRFLSCNVRLAGR